MDCKLKDLLQLAQSQDPKSASTLQKLLNQDLPASTSFDLMPLAEAIEKEVERYESVRKPVLEKYGEVKEDTNMVEIKEENREEFIEEMNELLEKEVELPSVKISKEILADAKLSTIDLLKLKSFISE